MGSRERDFRGIGLRALKSDSVSFVHRQMAAPSADTCRTLRGAASSSSVVSAAFSAAAAARLRPEESCHFFTSSHCQFSLRMNSASVEQCSNWICGQCYLCLWKNCRRTALGKGKKSFQLVLLLQLRKIRVKSRRVCYNKIKWQMAVEALMLR
jgi:hypothetical protein